MSPLRDGSQLAADPPASGPISPSVSGFDSPAVQEILADIRDGMPGASSLDPQEISLGVSSSGEAAPTWHVGHGIPAPGASDPKALVLQFRHSGWRDQREAILAALNRTGQSPGRIERFCECGTAAWVLQEKGNPGRYRISCNRCHDRFCIPCSTERRNTVAANLRANLPDFPVRLMTLTLKHSPAPLAEQLDRLYSCFGRFRNNRKISHALRSGLAFLELKISERDQCWHPHLHVLWQGQYLDQALARKVWLAVTGDSFIVDLRAVRGTDGAASYVAKYATKALAPSVWRNRDRLCEAIVALLGRRTFNVFGAWRGFHLSKPPADDLQWEYLCPLSVLIERAKGGDAAAYVILNALKRIDADEPQDFIPGPAPPDPR